jgi:hypothetical protein
VQSQEVVLKMKIIQYLICKHIRKDHDWDDERVELENGGIGLYRCKRCNYLWWMRWEVGRLGGKIRITPS